MPLKCRDAINVDVYTGALSEPPLDGAIVGPLLNCLITDQFLRLKKGDSYWYERRVGSQRFTNGMFQWSRPMANVSLRLPILIDQLAQIYGTTLAAIICRNSNSVNDVQRFVMRNIGPNNPVIACSDIDTFSFVPWKEDPYYRNLVSVKTTSQQSSIKMFPPNWKSIKFKFKWNKKKLKQKKNNQNGNRVSRLCLFIHLFRWFISHVMIL